MPFKSRAQLRKFGALANRGEITKRKEWRDETPSISGLPERASAASRVKSGKTPTGLRPLTPEVKPRKRGGARKALRKF